MEPIFIGQPAWPLDHFEITYAGSTNEYCCGRTSTATLDNDCTQSGVVFSCGHVSLGLMPPFIA